MVALLLLLFGAATGVFCSPSMPSCWPTTSDEFELRSALGSGPRVLSWSAGSPRVCAVPIGSQNEQPLYGFGVQSMSGLYSRSPADLENVCFDGEPLYASSYCLAATRNAPYNNEAPGFVVWPLTTQHVVSSVLWAKKHNLCISVASSGSDVLNRHSCKDSLLIRTTLMKDITFDLSSSPGVVMVGAGVTFSELHKAASDRQRVVSSGWVSTLSVVAWSLAGGHGPFAPSTGLGVDNVVSFTLVTSKGETVVADSSNNTDLFWALRGGGGSAFGVVVSVVLKLHAIPTKFTIVSTTSQGVLCNTDLTRLQTLISNYLSWSLTLSSKWAGYAFFLPVPNQVPQCNCSWAFFLKYVYSGSNTDQEFVSGWASLAITGARTEVTVDSWWQQVQQEQLVPIYPFNNAYITPNNTVGGLPSVFISRSVAQSGILGSFIRDRLLDCKNSGLCAQQELYQDLTGNKGSPQPSGTSISASFRNSLMQYVGGINTWDAQKLADYHSLGDSSYFAESAYRMDDWKKRYWGTNYSNLVSVKRQYDPQFRFYCYHCVGSDSGSTDVNGDGKIDLQDIVSLLNKWGSSDPLLDLNVNGAVDLGDVIILLNYFGSSL